MKKIIAIITLIALVVSLTGCSGEIYYMTPADSQPEVVKENTQSQSGFEILSSKLIRDHAINVVIFLDTNENILYGFIGQYEIGEVFMLVDPSGNPYVYDGDPTHIPDLVFHEKKSLRDNSSSLFVLTYTFSDSIYNIRYALVCMGGHDGAGRVVTLLDANGKPSIY